jgi:hypothetical protein
MTELRDNGLVVVAGSGCGRRRPETRSQGRIELARVSPARSGRILSSERKESRVDDRWQPMLKSQSE